MWGILAVTRITAVMVHKRCFKNFAKKSLLILRSAGIFLYRFFCGILAGRIAKGLGTAMAVAGNAGGVVIAIEGAGVVAGGIESGNDVFLFVENLHVLVNTQAAERYQHGSSHLAGEEGGLFNRGHKEGLFVEVLIYTFAGQFVVAVNRGFEGFIRQLALFGQIFNGVGFFDQAFFDVAFHIFRIVMEFHFLAGSLMESRGFLRPFGIPNVPFALAGLLAYLVGKVPKGQILVAEALAFEIDAQPWLTGQGIGIFLGIIDKGLVKVHGCMRPFVNVCTNPEAHLLAVTGVEGAGVRNLVDGFCTGNVVVQHFLIMAIIAGAENNGFFGIELDVGLIFILSDYTGDAACMRQ